MKILFMGTPDFAKIILESLVDSGYDVIGAVTQPDKPKGRGYTLLPPPVKEYALEKGIPVYQPNTLRGEEFDTLLHQLDPGMIVVAAYGKILPDNVLDYAEYGCINVHGSLLPEYRGAAPMQRAILDGKPVTGVTIMKMDSGIDTGDMLLKEEVVIEDSDDFGTLHDKMAAAGAKALLTAIPMIADGSITAEKQPAEGTYASKIEKEDTKVDFSKPARTVFNQIRGLSPFPLSSSSVGELVIKFVSSEIASETGSFGKPGEVIALDGKITVACGEGSIAITSLLPAGKSRMSAADFIRGRKISVGDIFASV